MPATPDAPPAVLSPNSVLANALLLANLGLLWALLARVTPLDRTQRTTALAALAWNPLVLFELAGVDEKTAREALRLASQKLPISTKIITRAEQEAEVAS